MKTLKPLIFKDEYYRAIEKKINKLLLDILFKPLADNIKGSVKNYYNAKGSLITALQKGRIQYVQGKFYGSFNAVISKDLKKIGAKFAKGTKTFNLSLDKLPMDVQQAVAQGIAVFEGLNTKLLKSLDNDNILQKLDELNFGKDYERVVLEMNGDFLKASEVVGVVPEFTLPMITEIAENYSNNLKLYVKDWTEKEIFKLRGIVEQNTWEGYRAENLVKSIQQQFGVAKAKAKFLARQETSLLMSQFRKQRFSDVGIDFYRWSTSGDERTRLSHKALDGKICSFSDDSVYADSVAKAEKGEWKSRSNIGGYVGDVGTDFGCRCVGVGLIV